MFSSGNKDAVAANFRTNNFAFEHENLFKFAGIVRAVFIRMSRCRG